MVSGLKSLHSFIPGKFLRKLRLFIFLFLSLSFLSTALTSQALAVGSRIDIEQFKELNRDQKLIIIHELQSLSIAIEQLSRFGVNRKKVYSNYLQRFNLLMQQVFVAKAHAQSVESDNFYGIKDLKNDQRCMYAGWVSVMFSGKCMHPANLSDLPNYKKIYDLYKAASEGVDKCTKNDGIICNPALYGPMNFCSPGKGPISSKNSSLACYQHASSKGKSQDDLVLREIESNPTGFSKLLKLAYSMCLCKGISPGKKGTRVISQKYAENLYYHRTCTGLMGQVKNIIKSLEDNSCLQAKNSSSLRDLYNTVHIASSRVNADFDKRLLENKMTTNEYMDETYFSPEYKDSISPAESAFKETMETMGENPACSVDLNADPDITSGGNEKVITKIELLAVNSKASQDANEYKLTPTLKVYYTFNGLETSEELTADKNLSKNYSLTWTQSNNDSKNTLKTSASQFYKSVKNIEDSDKKGYSVTVELQLNNKKESSLDAIVPWQKEKDPNKTYAELLYEDSLEKLRKKLQFTFKFEQKPAMTTLPSGYEFSLKSKDGVEVYTKLQDDNNGYIYNIKRSEKDFVVIATLTSEDNYIQQKEITIPMISEEDKGFTLTITQDIGEETTINLTAKPFFNSETHVIKTGEQSIQWFEILANTEGEEEKESGPKITVQKSKTAARNFTAKLLDKDKKVLATAKTKIEKAGDTVAPNSDHVITIIKTEELDEKKVKLTAQYKSKGEVAELGDYTVKWTTFKVKLATEEDTTEEDTTEEDTTEEDTTEDKAVTATLSDEIVELGTGLDVTVEKVEIERPITVKLYDKDGTVVSEAEKTIDKLSSDIFDDTEETDDTEEDDDPFKDEETIGSNKAPQSENFIQNKPLPSPQAMQQGKL